MTLLNFSKIIYKLTKLTLLIWLVYIILSFNKIPDFNEKNIISNSLFQNKDVLNQINSLNLIIAHPDDEIMFFSPSLLKLNDLLPGNATFNIFCYSNGDAQGLGSIRSNELHKTVNLLLSDRKNKNITILDYLDGMSEIWDIDKMLQDFELFMNDSNNFVEDNKKNLILTFDQFGVSNHINHRSCYLMSWKYYQKFSDRTVLLTLDSYHNNLLLKYSSFGWQFLKLLFSLYYPFPDGKVLSTNSQKKNITIFSTYPQYVLALATMLNAHKSQMVWFRYLWWIFSRFVFVNDIEVHQN